MTTHWNPREVLDLYPDEPNFTCSGTTQRGLRCKNRVNIADRQKASKLLDKLAQRNVVSRGVDDRMEERLEHLAEYTLCLRNHRRSQIADVFEEWTEDIEQFRLDEKRKERVARRVQRLSTRTISAENSTPITETRVQEATSGTVATVARSLHSSRQSITTPLFLTATTTRPRSSPLAPLSTNQSHSTTPGPSRLSSPPLNPSNHIHTPNLAPTSKPATQKPLTEDCYVCYESFKKAEDAVYCRRCGQNIHETCFRQWSSSCRKASAEVTCGFCRAPWLKPLKQ